jgi:hypothetical protein
MSILGSIVSSIVVMFGTCGMNKGDDKVTLAVQHPDTCFMLSPKPLADALSMGGDIISVKPGPTKFEFDCNGKQLEVTKDIKQGMMTLTVSPDSGSASGE